MTFFPLFHPFVFQLFLIILAGFFTNYKNEMSISLRHCMSTAPSHQILLPILGKSGLEK